MTKSLPLPKNVRSLSVRAPETVTGDVLRGAATSIPVAIHGQGFRSAAVEENVALKYPAAASDAFNIGILHTSLETESGGEHARYAPCKIADLVGKNYDYWALGHIHKRQIVRSEPWIVYPGNLQGRHIRETGEKGAMLVTVDGQLSSTCQFVPLDVFRWDQIRADVSGAAAASQAIDMAADALRDTLSGLDSMPRAVRIQLCGQCAAHEELAADSSYWKNQLRAAALNVAAGEVWIEKVRLETWPEDKANQPDSGPILEIIDHVAELLEDEARLAGLSGELSPLAKKLPDEFRTGDAAEEPLRLDDPDWLRRMLNEVRPMLIRRLSGGGSSP
jgi:DNA repair exonuclease SbcCD nuclease subunit